MQQRVNLARALITKPSILLMDEPFSSLDEITRENMQDELIRIWQASKNTVAFVTHSIPEAVYLSDRVFVLTAEGMTEIGVPLARPRTRKMKQSKSFHHTVNRLQRALGGHHA
jgi:NitT/TauT family transport system ATP-binding protein